jgi:hypothetical protein
MAYGVGSFSQHPYSTLPGGRDIDLSGTTDGATDVSASSVSIVRRKVLLATGNNGRTRTLTLTTGNFTAASRISDSRIDGEISQGGRVRTGFIVDTNGIASYEIIESIH